VTFAVLAAVCVIAAITAAVVAVLGAQDDREQAERAVRKSRPAALRVLSGGQPFVAFRVLNRDDSANYTRFAVASLTDEGPGRALPAGPSCVRLTFRAGAGVCLGQPGPTTFPVIALDGALKETRRLALAGIPSRSRISPDGRYAGITAFITGHSYAQPGQFSTAATIVDLRTGKVAGDLERDFKVTVDGKVMSARDRNFWGVTFAADNDTFYATAATGGKTWLIRGSVAKRTAHAIHSNAECPSLSPDGKRIAFKKAVGGPGVWRFTVLDLASGRETRLSEKRSIDDQLEWLDDDHLLYALADTSYVVAADGSGTPDVFMHSADSPAVVRP
jgi:hypothetical protein